MKFSLHHLLRQAEIPNDSPPMLILLHGVGSNEFDLFSLASYLDKRLLILSARAPNVLGSGSYAWFPVEIYPDKFVIDPDKAEESRNMIIDFVAEAVEFYGANPEQVYLMGFSQGAIMSFSVMLTQPDILAGVVGMSGRILPEIKPIMTAEENLKDFPVLVVHGSNDQVIPISNGQASNELLSSLPVDLTYKEYVMGHEISNDSLQDIVEWIKQRLDSAS